MEAFFKSLLGIAPEQLQSGIIGRVIHVLGAVFAAALGLAILLIEPEAIQTGANPGNEVEGIPFTSKLVFAGLMFAIAVILVRQAFQSDKTKN